MARKAKNYIKASFFHIMVQGLNKEYIFNSDIDKKEYLKNIKENQDKYNINIISYCVMSNHVHLLLGIKEVSNLSKFMHRINTLYALYYNKKYNRVGYVYRDRYKSQTIYTERQLYTCINYIHNNPVKAEICKYPNEYKYSSFNDFNKSMNVIENINLSKQENENIIFIEDEEQRDKEIKETISSYLLENEIKMQELNKNRKYLEQLVYILKSEYNVSLRKIAIYLNISREIVRKIGSKRGVPSDQKGIENE